MEGDTGYRGVAGSSPRLSPMPTTRKTASGLARHARRPSPHADRRAPGRQASARRRIGPVVLEAITRIRTFRLFAAAYHAQASEVVPGMALLKEATRTKAGSCEASARAYVSRASARSSGSRRRHRERSTGFASRPSRSLPTRWSPTARSVLGQSTTVLVTVEVRAERRQTGDGLHIRRLSPRREFIRRGHLASIVLSHEADPMAVRRDCSPRCGVADAESRPFTAWRRWRSPRRRLGVRGT